MALVSCLITSKVSFAPTNQIIVERTDKGNRNGVLRLTLGVHDPRPFHMPSEDRNALRDLDIARPTRYNKGFYGSGKPFRFLHRQAI